ncbi:MAG: hypothetical protein MMC33_006008 [Icmadophila ericetorum]|nr:hypothetical protein [Icmadophila ericetorum]
MASRLTHAAEQSPAKRKPSTGIPKHKKTTAPKKSSPTRANRLRGALTGDFTPPIDHNQAQAEASVDSLITEANQLKPAQPLSKTPKNLDESPRSQGRKLKRGLEEEESHKRRRAPSPSAGKPAVAFTPLNKKDLAELDKLNRQKDPEAFDGMKNKRSRSQSSITDCSEDTITTISVSTHKSSFSLSNYRLITLDRQRIVFQHNNLPEHVQMRLDFVLQSLISEDDKREVTSIARLLQSRSPSVQAVSLAHIVSDWDPALKPTVQRRRCSSVLLVKPPNDTNSALDESSKERQPYMTPDRSASTMPPPPCPPKQDAGGVKTPCPDITIGLHHDIVAVKLESVGVLKPHADELLKDLQYGKALISCPAQPALLLRFPPLVVEGKSYATGKILYEAQN